MKSAVLSLTAGLSLLQFAAAQPHRRHAHEALHAKKDVVTFTNTVFAEETAAPVVVVVVDANGVAVSTTTQNAYASPTATQSASIAVSTSAAAVAPAVQAAVFKEESTSSTEVYVASSSVEVVESSTSSASAATSSAASSDSSSSSNGYGFTYGPYYADGTCKDAAAVLTDLQAISSDYSVVRTYGTDCSTVESVLAACKKTGLKLFAGIYDLATLSDEISTVTAAADGDWSNFYGVSIGNELVNSGTADADTVMAAVATGRSSLQAAGFTGPVGTVDTLVAARSNPKLCDESDICWVNAHPFFDGSTLAAASGVFLKVQIETLRLVLSDSSQSIVVTETGWPWKGDDNNEAVPSTANQEAAIASIKTAYASSPGDVFLFNIYNMYWKTSNADQFNAEPYWGFVGDAPSG